MPTEIVAQNGAEFHQETKIAVSGCPKVTGVRTRHHRKKHKAKRKCGKGKKR